MDLNIHHTRNAVREYNPFQNTTPDMPDICWQDWVRTTGVLDNTGNHFVHRGPHGLHGSCVPGTQQMLLFPITTSGGGESSATDTQPLELIEKVIGDILAATRALPS